MRWDAVWLSHPRLLTATATAAAVGFGAAWLICSLRQPKPQPRPHARGSSEDGGGHGAASLQDSLPRSANLRPHAAGSSTAGSEPAAHLQPEAAQVGHLLRLTFGERCRFFMRGHAARHMCRLT